MNNLYIDLDSLLDTRLGIFMEISSDLAALVYNDDYKRRDADIFKYMSNLEFRERYSKKK